MPLVTVQNFALHEGILPLIPLLSYSNSHAKIRLLSKQKNSGQEQYIETADACMS